VPPFFILAVLQKRQDIFTACYLENLNIMHFCH